jgi:hypothetical protein
MNIQNKDWRAMFLIALVFVIFACKLLEEENKKTIKREYYAIEPDSILESLARGEVGVFSLTTDDIDYSAPPPGPTVQWKQSDYFSVIKAFYGEVLGGTLQGWSLNSMGFFLSCKEVDYGLQDGRFEFFKVINNGREREVRVFRFIDIDTRYKLVTFREEEHYPKLIDWSSIDLASIEIGAEDALQIAEDNGGRERRISVNDSCFISVGIAPDSVTFSGWRISYSLSENPTSFFSIEVDPITGEIHVP